MAHREERIAAGLREAAVLEASAEEQRQAFFAKSEQLDRERSRLLSQAREDAETEKNGLLEAARSEVAERQGAWQQQIRDERSLFLNKLRHASADAILMMVRKALEDLANADLEQQIVGMFVGRLAEVGPMLREQWHAHGGAVNIATSFALNEDMRACVMQAVHEHISSTADLNYAVSDSIICGIELTIAGQRVAWDVADYCQSLDERVVNALDAPTLVDM